MTDRDHFAAAALTGLLVHAKDGIDEETLDTPSDIAYTAYAMADAMLRERCRAGADCPLPDNAPNHDAAPAARADSPDERPPHAVSASGGTPSAASRDGSGTGDTQSFDAYRRFAGQVMNWISEATGFLHDDVLRTDDARDIITDACSRCWDAFGRIAYPTDHGASPEAIARTDADSDRTDKAAPRPGEGTGDTPVTNPLPKEKRAEVSSEPVAWGVANRNGLLATSIHRIDAVDMQSEFACDTEIVPLYQAPDFAPPPPDNAAKAPDNAEPVAWAVCCPGDGNWSPCFFHEPHAQRHASAILGSKNIIPLYRQPPCQDSSQKNLTLTDAEREALHWFGHYGLPEQRAAVLRGLLERLG